MSSKATRQPSTRNRLTVPKPMPRAAPVTVATFCMDFDAYSLLRFIHVLGNVSWLRRESVRINVGVINKPHHRMAAGGATERPRTLWRSMSRATKPDAFASSTKSRKNAAPAGFFREVPIAC